MLDCRDSISTPISRISASATVCSTFAASSHVGVANRALQNGRLDRRLEAWVPDATSRTEALARAFKVFLDWKSDVYQKDQDTFEAPDTLATLQAIGGQTDNDLTPP